MQYDNWNATIEETGELYELLWEYIIQDDKTFADFIDWYDKEHRQELQEKLLAFATNKDSMGWNQFLEFRYANR